VACFFLDASTIQNDSNHALTTSHSFMTTLHDPPSGPPDQITPECYICYDSVSVREDPMYLHTSNPCKPYSCCRSCALTYISGRVKEKQCSAEVLKCPAGCGESLAPGDVRKIIMHPSLLLPVSHQQAQWQSFRNALNESNSVQAARNRRMQRIVPSLSDMREDLAFHMWSKGANTVRLTD
jgi:hypothetical protein